nr:uncharacterized protein LOC129280062 [Lytechinus pictus]
MSSLRSCPYVEIYGSSKFAVEEYFESLSISLRSFNIWICLVEPSEVSTGLLAQSKRDFASEANDRSIDDIDSRQLKSLNKYVKAMPNHTPDVVAKEIATRCLDVEDPVLRHLVITRGRDEIREMLSDLTGEKRIKQMVKAISRL